MYANYVVSGGGLGGPKDDFLPVGVGSPKWKGVIFGGGIGPHTVTYRKHAALQCGCSVDSSTLSGRVYSLP